jgi:hypothetical protein
MRGPPGAEPAPRESLSYCGEKEAINVSCASLWCVNCASPGPGGCALAEFDLHFTMRPSFMLSPGSPASFSHYVGGLPTDARGLCAGNLLGSSSVRVIS